MLHKLQTVNGISIPCLSKNPLIDKIFNQLARLIMEIFSRFIKNNSSELSKISNNTQHLQYEVYHLVGEVNIKNSALMKKELLMILDSQKSVILDFTKLDFIDSSGIATLIESLNITHASGLKLAIVGARNLPLKMLELTKLDKVFTLFNSLQDIKI
ncbi:MAG: STAS domain-containing protein [Colwellia sp.]|nr:STAS domain-containing protein [Colwellia sp.]